MSHRRHSGAFRPLALLFSLVLATALPRASSARIIDVPAQQPTLQAAAAAAANGDTVLFAPGTYTGGVWLPDKAIVVASKFITTGDTAYIAQTVLTGTVANVCGGAAGCTGDAIVEFGTHADGGALIGLTLTNAVKGLRTSCRTDIDHCHAMGMVLAGDGVNYLPKSSGIISNCLFLNNRDDGIDLNGEVNITVVNNIVMGNADDGIEYRMYPWAGATMTLTVTGNRFIRNGEDGIQLIDSPDSSHREVRIERNLFDHNVKATVGCMADQNTTEDYSGAPLAEHVVFANNTVVGDSYGVCGGANSVVVNNLFTGIANSALRRIGGNSTCTYNLLWGNGLDIDSSNVDPAHTLLADPRLDTSRLLTSGSPAIDYGTASFAWRGLTILNLPPSAYTGAGPDLGAFEFGGTGPPTNAAPVVSAGAAQTITLPADAALDGTVTDDGLPNPPGALTTTWSIASGPAAVAFQDPGAVDTRAIFTVAGTYLLRLTASDGALSTSATVQVTVLPGSAPAATLERRIATSTDDAEESATGSLSLSSFDLELVYDASNQVVGMRFTNIAIPPGTTVTRAYVQFQAREAQSEVTSLTVRAQAADNPGTFSFTDKVSPRPRTTAQAIWSPPAWAAGEAGGNQRTPDLSAVIQEVVNRPGWASGNALVLVINGTGHRTAWSFDGLAAGAPLLHIETGTPPPPPPPPPPSNSAPVVNAGPDQAITLPADAVLDGTVSDDGMPNPPATVSTNWTLISGPAAVGFLSSSSVDTRATFSVPGTYLLALAADDGSLTAADSVVITVHDGVAPGNAAPTAYAGPDQIVTLPAEALLDGTVGDDGLPSPPGRTTTTWDLVSGPGGVAFWDPSAVDTRAGFGATGVYLLSLTAYDGALATSDTVRITVQNQPPPPPTNVAPVVSAGPAQTITLPADAVLDGTVSDDGMPNPPGALTTTWAMSSGPAAVTFLDASAVDTRATFHAAGTYVLRLSATDGALTTTASVQVTVLPAPAPPVTVDRRIATGSDDAEESASGSLSLASTDIELVFDISSNQTVGLRFTNVAIPPGASISRAYVQFEADEVQSEPTDLAIHAQAADNPGTFSFTDKVSSRPRTAASTSWAPVEWDLVAEAGPMQRTPDLSAVIQEVVNRPGWASGNAIVIIVTGTGHRTARAFEGVASGAALLHVEAGGSPPPPPPANVAPVVDAGPGQTITLPADAALQGTVSDDGLPNPPGALTTTWTLVSGPAAVAFQNASQVSTRATFSAPGNYLLRLTASDGALATSDSVLIAVNPAPLGNTAPVVSAGAAQTITLPADAALDGTVTDDGLPNPPGALTTTWSLDSGPAAVTFQNGSAVDTRATFTVAGTYVLRLTAADGALSTSATVQITVQPAPTATIVERRIAAGVDDAEESAAGVVTTGSGDLELVYDGSNQWVGMRFTNLTVPRGATITHAYVQFQARETQSEATNLTIHSQAADNALTFSSGTISGRPRSTAQATWAPPAWATVGEAGLNQRTPDLSAVLQEVVSRPGWASGNALVVLVNGTGHRTAWAYEGLAAGAPLLHVEYGAPPPPPPNSAPVVSAGAAQTITLPADALLDGTVSDDGLPNPPGALSTTWSLDSGPAAVTFQNPNAVDTGVAFSVAGTYVFRLTAADGALSTSATVQITVQPGPAATTVERRIAAGVDDAEESATGVVTTGSGDLELVYDGSNQWVGMRFATLAIPRGATITRAYVQFQAKEAQSEATNLAIHAQAADNAANFATAISTRPRTTAQATWAPPAWATVGEAGLNQRTPDLAAVVQEVVSRTGWVSGNALVLVINGTGHRTAWAFEGLAAGAPLLHVEYSGAAPPVAASARAEIAAVGVEFGFHRLSPNPSRGALTLEFSLADNRPAYLQVIDVSGRRVAERDLGSPGPGRHVFELREPLPPGLYGVRLVQGSAARVIKAVVVK
jgi:parallel beta helix pectate lyase-like protein/K319-like protein